MTFEVDERVPLSQHSKTEVVLQCIFDHHDCFHDKYPDCGAKSTMHELNLPSASVWMEKRVLNEKKEEDDNCNKDD